MALSRIWSAFILVAFIVAFVKFVTIPEKKDIFTEMVTGKQGDTSFTKVVDSASLLPVIIAALNKNSSYKSDENKYVKQANGKVLTYKEQQTGGVIATCELAVTICFNLIGVMALFMGFLTIAEKAGGMRLLAKIIGPFFSKLFPEVPKNHPSIGYMMMNFSANLLNLDNAATPFGIKTMESLQELNPKKDKATNAQLMFLCLHAAGLTLVPVTIIAARASVKPAAASPTDIFVPCMIATFVATMAAMIIVAIKQKINLLQPVILGWVLGAMGLIVLLVLYLTSLPADGVQHFSKLLSNGLILFIFIAIIVGALFKKIDIFNAFVDGAKGGFETAVKIIPYLVGMLVAISLLRTSGTFEVIIAGMKSVFGALGADTRFVDGLPTALIKPLSGGGARGMMIDTMNTHGADSFAGRLACVLQGSSDTTFYVVAVYFGAVGIKNTRYAISTMLIADLVGIITSILLCYLFFGNA
ncbi:MAG: nucleoside recognition domain-containing protein [Flavobacterium sp.]|nr:nucleoside recognition domain-containing protein [Flavobacterium sp.]